MMQPCVCVSLFEVMRNSFMHQINSSIRLSLLIRRDFSLPLQRSKLKRERRWSDSTVHELLTHGHLTKLHQPTCCACSIVMQPNDAIAPGAKKKKKKENLKLLSVSQG